MVSLKKKGLILIFWSMIGPAQTTPLYAEDPWPKFHHDLQNTGQSKYTGPQSITPLNLKFTYTTEGPIRSSPAISKDGTIYVGSDDGKLYAINPNGTLKWSYPTGGPILSSPTIGKDGTIYVGSFDNKLYAINPDGTLKWSFPTMGRIFYSSPAISEEGIIYIGSHDKRLYAISSEGTERWRYRADDQILMSPAISNGRIYFGSRCNYLYALDLDRNLKWRWGEDIFPERPKRLYSSPAVNPEKRTIYFGSRDNKLYAIEDKGTYAEKKWEFETGGEIYSSPAISSDGTIYIGSYDGKLYAIEDKGTYAEKKWEFETGGEIFSSPAIGQDGTIYFGSKDKKLYAVSKDGEPKWSYETGGKILSSPAISKDGTLYVGSSDGKLYAFTREPGTLGVDVEDVTWDIGSVKDGGIINSWEVGREGVRDGILVTNTGSIVCTFRLNTANSANWRNDTIGNNDNLPDVNEFVLRGIFDTTGIHTFGPEDRIPNTVTSATGTVFSDGDTSGASVGIGDSRLLWLQLAIPTAGSSTAPQTIQVTVTASAP